MAKAKKEQVSESTAVAVISPEEQAYLNSIPSAGGDKADYTGPKKLTINTKAKDENGVKRTIGAWHIQGTDIYSDAVAHFRPVRYAYKLIKYNVDGDNYTVAGQSIYFDNFGDEILDSMGGIALGRKFGSGYTEDEKAATRKNAETYLDIFGFVSFGEDEEQHPVMYRVRGSKIMTMMNAFRAIPKDKRYSQFSFDIETDQPEGKTYWDIKVTPDMSKTLPITPILAFDNSVVEFIRDSNTYVINMHKKSRTSKVEAGLESSAKSKMVDVTPSNVIDEELPF